MFDGPCRWALLALLALAPYGCAGHDGSAKSKATGSTERRAQTAGVSAASQKGQGGGGGTVISDPALNLALTLPDDWIALRADRDGYAADIVQLRENAPAAAAAIDRYDPGFGEILAVRSIAVRRDGLAVFTLTSISGGLEGDEALGDVAAKGDEQARDAGGKQESLPDRLDGMEAYFVTADMPDTLYGKPYPPHSVSYLVSTPEAVVQLSITGSIPDGRDLLRQANFHA